MSQFDSNFAHEAMSRCLRPGESLLAFTQASDVGGMRTGMWEGAGTTWIGLTSARMLSIPSANGEVFSTPWSEVATFVVKSGLLSGSRLARSITVFPDYVSEFKIDKPFAKLAQQIWREPKTELPLETTTVTEHLYERLNQQFWFCDACGQPCGTPDYSETPDDSCHGCERTIVGLSA